MIAGGYVLQPRRVDESEIINMPPVVRELWFYLIRKVNHRENGMYARGQGFFNLSEIQEDLCWYVGYRKMTYSKPQLTKSLRRLCEESAIATTKATRGIIVTVLNYERYQDPASYESNGEGNTKETRRKWEGHTKNKNVKNVRSKEVKHMYGEFENVSLSGDEFAKLNEKFGPEAQALIERLSGYVASTGKRYKSHYATILNWARKDGAQKSKTAQADDVLSEMKRRLSDGEMDTGGNPGRVPAAELLQIEEQPASGEDPIHSPGMGEIFSAETWVSD